jgi:predicted Fe-Mo cluster-binding NifX family protein
MDPIAAETMRDAYDERTTTHHESEYDMNAETTPTRVAIPSEAPGGLEALRSGHFGRCQCFTMVDIVDGKVGEVQVLTNAPHVEGGCMAPVLVLAEHNVNAIVVDGIGGRPLMGFNQVGIAVHAGVGGDVKTAVQAFIDGGLPVVGLEGACHH